MVDELILFLCLGEAQRYSLWWAERCYWWTNVETGLFIIESPFHFTWEDNHYIELLPDSKPVFNRYRGDSICEYYKIFFGFVWMCVWCLLAFKYPRMGTFHLKSVILVDIFYCILLFLDIRAVPSIGRQSRVFQCWYTPVKWLLHSLKSRWDVWAWP